MVHFEYTGERYVPKDVTHVQFHPAVTQIEDYAFEDCTKLRQVILNEGLLKIGNNAFHECRVLSSISLPSTVIEIGTYVFYNCYRLLEVELNEGLRKIGFQAFANCNVLQSIHLPSTLTDIDQYAFQKCSSLRTLMLNEGLQKLGKGAFDSCTALERVTFSSTMKEVDDYAFKGCSQLREVVLAEEGLEKVGKGAFQDCKALETVIIPSTVQKIGNAAFCNCTSLKEVVAIESIPVVGFYAFKGCTAFERLTFPGISTRLNNIINAGQSGINDKVNEMCLPTYTGIGGSNVRVRREGTELFVSAQDRPATYNWRIIGYRMDSIINVIEYYEFKEATTLFELALWKAKIDQSDDTSSSVREACRVEVPGPVKDKILQYAYRYDPFDDDSDEE